MDSEQLRQLAVNNRSLKEAGITLLLASGILAFFFFLVPSTPAKTVSAPIAIATSTQPDALANIILEAQAAIVYDLATHETLYAKNADAQLPLASLTKLLTVYTALTELSPTTPVTISAQAARLESPHAFSAGETLSLADLARLTLTASLNDGAAAIAETTAARKGQTQVEMFASAAASLNLSQTYAVNGSGLDVSRAISGGYGSAHDLALLAGALVAKAPAIAAATTESSAQATSEAGTLFTVKNTDPIINTIPRLLLSKTGYTDLAQGNLAIVFDAGILHPIAVVVLGSSKEARFTDSSTLIAATLAHFSDISSL